MGCQRGSSRHTLVLAQSPLSARGFRAFDRDDREVGCYPNPDLAARALLELAVAEAA
jgi:hypothetical protein